MVRMASPLSRHRALMYDTTDPGAVLQFGAPIGV